MPLSKTSLMVCRFNPVAFSAAGKEWKTSWVRPELVPKISFCLGEKKCFIFGKNETLWKKRFEKENENWVMNFFP